LLFYLENVTLGGFGVDFLKMLIYLVAKSVYIAMKGTDEGLVFASGLISPILTVRLFALRRIT